MELLAPAKNMAYAKAVLSCGADAVYFGGKMFGARAYADNFGEDEILSLVDYCHLFGKRAYMTVNTLLKDDELEERLFHYVKPLYARGLDAVLVQDFGVFRFLRESFPELPIHVSTQMNVTSPYGARFLKEQGASRIVLARELSLQEIAAVHEAADVELEVFVHGALCVCYSGQCLMSSMMGARSGNRGACGQACRLTYKVSDETGDTYGTSDGFPLSTKDLCGIHDLAALRDAGVTSLKVEGRMKGLHYATTVTSIYRKYLDIIEKEGRADYEVDAADEERLLAAGNRSGFTNAYYYKRNDPQMMSLRNSAHRGGGADTDVSTTPLTLPVQCKVDAVPGQPLAVTFLTDGASHTATGAEVDVAKSRSTTREEICQKLQKTGGYPFTVAKMDVSLGEAAFVPMKTLNELRRAAMDGLYERLLLAYHKRPTASLSDMDAVPDIAGRGKGDFFLTAGEDVPRIVTRVINKEQFDACAASPLVRGIKVPRDLWNLDGTRDDCQLVYSLPEIIRNNNAAAIKDFVLTHPNAYYEANSYDGLGLLFSCGILANRISCGMRLYAWSNRTRHALLGLGVESLYVPVELSFKELLHRDNHGDHMMVYGRIPLMFTANCVKKCHIRCDREKTTLYLTDQKGYAFPVVNDCANCTNVVYNSVPLSLFSEAGDVCRLRPGAIELSFVTEDKGAVEDLLSRCAEAFIRTPTPSQNDFKGAAKRRGDIHGRTDGAAPTTKGHFRRGVKE